MKGISKSACFTILVASLFGQQPTTLAAQFFEFNFEISGYRDVTASRFGGPGPIPNVGEMTDTSVNIQILGTDRNADGVLEFRQYSAVWTDSFGTVNHGLDDVAPPRGFSTLRFVQPSLQITSLDLESHPLDNTPNEVIVLGGRVGGFASAIPDDSFVSFLETSAPGFGVARSCGDTGVANTEPCQVTLTAREVPEHLGPWASAFVLGIGVALKKKFNSRRATFGR